MPYIGASPPETFLPSDDCPGLAPGLFCCMLETVSSQDQSKRNKPAGAALPAGFFMSGVVGA
jgi:hypothetical protein